MIGDDLRECRIYRKREKFRARPARDGIGWEVFNAKGVCDRYLDEDFHKHFEICVQSAEIIDSKTKTIHYA